MIEYLPSKEDSALKEKEKEKKKGQMAVLLLLVSGGVSYSLGLRSGFLTCFGGFLFPAAGPPVSFTVPIWFFAVYPGFSLVCLLGFPLPSSGLSPFSLCFLLLVMSACVLAGIGRLFEGFLLALTAFMLGGLQCVIVFSTTGFESLGAGLMLSATNPFGYPPHGFLLHSGSVVYLLASEGLLAAVSAICIHRFFVRERELRGVDSPSREHFQALKTMYTKLNMILIPLCVFLVGAVAYSLLRFELPHYGLLLNLLNPSHDGFLNGVLVFELLLIPLLLAPSLLFRRMSRLLAEKFQPLVERITEERPIIPFEELRRLLNAQEDAGYFKEFVNRLASVSGKRGYNLGVYKDYLYAEKPLVQIAEREIEKHGGADLYDIAQEIFIHPDIVKTIYSFLVFRGAIRGFTVTGEGYLVKAKGGRYGWAV